MQESVSPITPTSADSLATQLEGLKISRRLGSAYGKSWKQLLKHFSPDKNVNKLLCATFKQLKKGDSQSVAGGYICHRSPEDVALLAVAIGESAANGAFSMIWRTFEVYGPTGVLPNWSEGRVLKIARPATKSISLELYKIVLKAWLRVYQQGEQAAKDRAKQDTQRIMEGSSDPHQQQLYQQAVETSQRKAQKHLHHEMKLLTTHSPQTPDLMAAPDFCFSSPQGVLAYLQIAYSQDLVDFCSVDPCQYVQERDLPKLANALIGAMRYLHTHEIVHLDIKPDNVLVAPDGSFKLGDMAGAVKIADAVSQALKTKEPPVSTCTPCYISRDSYEQLEETVADIVSKGNTSKQALQSALAPTLEKLDIQASGATLFWMATDLLPWGEVEGHFSDPGQCGCGEKTNVEVCKLGHLKPVLEFDMRLSGTITDLVHGLMPSPEAKPF